jgi:hypothetical protein
MALLNLTAFTPQMAFAVCRAAEKSNGSATMEHLRSWLSPGPLQQPSSEAGTGLNQAVQFCRNFGLIEEHGGFVKSKHGAMSLHDFRSILVGAVLAEDRNQDFMGATDLDAHELTRALAWFLQVPCMLGPFRTGDYERLQAGGPRVIENDTRWTVFDRWSVFLGFAWRFDGGLIPDPADAIRTAVLAEVGDHRVSLPELVDKLGRSFPVLDGGSYRTAYLTARGEVWDGRSLSEPLSLALLRLEREGAITFLNVGDSEARTLRLGKDVDRSHQFVMRAGVAEVA